MKKLNIQDYIEDVDSQYSGMEGEKSYVNEEMYFSGAEGATRQMPPQLADPSPFIVTVNNTTDAALTAVLFGRNLFSQAANFGSAAALIVTNGFANSSYVQLLEQSAAEPFETSRIRIESSNITQVTKNFEIKITKADGESYSKPVVPQNYFSEMQFQGTIVTIPRAIVIDGNTYIEAVILAGASVTYTFFPREMVKTTRALGAIGKAPLQKFANAPQLIGTPSNY